MPSLLDVGDLTEIVEIRGKSVEVQGVSAAGLVVLLGKFPELRSLMTGTADESILKDLVGKLPEAVASIIALATTPPSDDPVARLHRQAAAEIKAAQLSVGEQLDLLTRIWKLTFPRGIRDFLAALETLASEVDVDSGKVPDTKSPGQSNGASVRDIPPVIPGDTPLGS